MWSPRQESNLYLSLRRQPFYPLNYEEGRWILPVLHAVKFVALFGSALGKAVIDGGSYALGGHQRCQLS